MLLGEERFKQTVMSVIAEYSSKGLTIGTEYYILKDIYNTVEKLYFDYINENEEKARKEMNQELEDNLNAAFENGETELVRQGDL